MFENQNIPSTSCLFSEEQSLKLQFSIIGHKLEPIKIKKLLKSRRETLSKNVEKMTTQQLRRKIDDLVNTINASDWKEEQKTMETKEQRLLRC
jgi:hypothetical protein